MTQAAPRSVAGDRRAPSRGDRQRALIIDAAVNLLGTVPIADLSVSQIAKRAGVTRPAFYFYFESKYAVVAAALEQVWREVEQATQGLDSWEFSESPAGLSASMINNMVRVWRANSALLTACAQARSSDAQLAKMWTDFVDQLTARVTRFVVALRDTGQIEPASDDVPALVKALIAMPIAILLDEPGTIPTDRLIEAVKSVWYVSIWRSGPRAHTVPLGVNES
ncbi:TetR/AcrR family transcriptional regulator [Hoyosella altamirensis]|uniref:AcrR family transcriptional regulator n=1 Tax=Hoyosella altamirensis TaxID=616997 RepID=A0A839RK98_9ACTN|nr:TetR/AcrR family transcriptional regulator [Hoyosella altamirensis]MBB3037085.1 AcrR family transcriptional regulator [Hoyosella altamirensis]